MPPWALLVVIPLGFVLWWVFVVWLAATLCGWGALARHYHAPEPFRGTLRRFRSGKVGWGNYSGCVTVGANSSGLYLAVFFPFRPGHPPLFIPWADVTARTVRGWLSGHWMELRFEKSPGVVVRLPRRLGEQIAADANRSWAEDAPDVK